MQSQAHALGSATQLSLVILHSIQNDKHKVGTPGTDFASSLVQKAR
jgi:hypothetical protein